MPEDKIQVDELPARPGERVAVAFVGPPHHLTLFEMRKVAGRGKKKERYNYYVERLQVSRDAYFDAMQTCSADRACACDIEAEGLDESPEALS